jgi:hypothetical protein
MGVPYENNKICCELLKSEEQKISHFLEKYYLLSCNTLSFGGSPPFFLEECITFTISVEE